MQLNVNVTYSELVERVKRMFSSRAHPTWINVEPLSFSAISTLVSRTLHRTKQDCAPLSGFIHRASCGNAFSVRSILTTLQRQRHVWSPSKVPFPFYWFLLLDFVWLEPKLLGVWIYHSKYLLHLTISTVMTWKQWRRAWSIKRSLIRQTWRSFVDICANCRLRSGNIWLGQSFSVKRKYEKNNRFEQLLTSFQVQSHGSSFYDGLGR